MTSAGPDAQADPIPAAALRDVATDDAGRLAEPVACRKCGYNLQGLPTAGRCPECGTAVGWSIHGDLLRYSDPAWVRQVADGALWLILSILVGIVLQVIGGVIDALTGQEMLTPTLAIVVAGMGLVGYWKLTAPDPGHVEAVGRMNVRRATRMLAVVGTFSAVADLLRVLPEDAPFEYYLAMQVTSGVLGIAGVAAMFLMFIILRRLALRIPHERLASRTRIVMWGVGALYAIVLVAGLGLLLVMNVGAGGMSSPMAGVLLVVTGIAGIPLLVFLVWWIVLLFQYRRALHAAANVALQTWMREGAVE